MTDENITAIGRCYGCKRRFRFDPDTVTMFLVDPETNLPPGMSPLGSRREPTPEALARSVKLPVCPACVERAKRVLEAGTDPRPPEFPVWHRPSS
ncbi:hypothetical protein GCM10009530_06720 [Microbispora corallina]|uniref:Uncharacterized protein n=1 Tax=Microbispora corallina TaxID=83302 RepID=A0ABQ4FUZ9_9ACTN|nr:hypothetical protein [Microbispora corallina]GIH38635.1 hypothetical protein Mco01_16350 [Microbispora corallina]